MEEGGDGPILRSIEPNETPSEAVVLAVAEATGRPAVPGEPGGGDALEDLYGAVDPDALDGLFRGRFDGRLEFDWTDCRVAVHGGTHVVVDPLD